MEETIYEGREYLLIDRTYDTGLWNTYLGRLFTSAAPPVDKTLGVDVSHWNGLSNFVLMFSKGVRFGIFKGTDVGWGSKKPFVDEQASYNYTSLAKAQMLVGSYCWLDPNPYSNAQEQANYFVDNIWNRYKLDIPPVLDFEDRDVISWRDMLSRAKIWLEVVKKRTGKTPIVYTSPGYMSAFSGLDTGFLKEYPLWVAHYIQRSYPSIPKPWTKYTIWQYSDRGHYPQYIYPATSSHGKEWGSGSHYLDMNWFNGTYFDLLDFCDKDLNEPEPEPEPEPDHLFTAECVAGLLNIRQGPSTSFSAIGLLKRGEVVKVYKVENNWFKIDPHLPKWVSGGTTYMKKIEDDLSQPEKKLYDIEILAYGLNIRSGAGVNHPIVGGASRGEVYPVYQEKDGWVRIGVGKWCSGHSLYVKKI